MTLDSHIHMPPAPADPQRFYDRLQSAGIDGALVISPWPAAFGHGAMASADERLEALMHLVGGHPRLYPFFWIDPLEDDAPAQVELAISSGAMGFKVICDRFFPRDARAFEMFQQIADAKKPILFHSGILWDGKDSSRYCRPAEFEALLRVDGLRFALAHIGWPWCDEMIAVYGKFLNAYGDRRYSGEMYIDLTPGTPPIYRREALTKLLTVGYDLRRNLLFGSDGLTSDYNIPWVREWIARDNAIYAELGLSESEIDAVYHGNLERFVGVAPNAARPRPVRVAE